MALLAQDLTHIVGGDDLPGADDGKLVDHPAELGIVMGPFIGLQQGEGLLGSTQNLPGHVQIHVTQQQIEEGGNLLLLLAQGGQKQGQAPQLVPEQGAHLGDVFSLLADAGEHDPVAAADIHFGQHGNQLILPLLGQHVQVGKIDGVALVGQGEL